jgi:hypothetical protein
MGNIPNSNVLRCLAANAVPKSDINTHTQAKKYVTKFLNRLGGSVADWGRWTAKNKKGRREAGLVMI